METKKKGGLLLAAAVLFLAAALVFTALLVRNGVREIRENPAPAVQTTAPAASAAAAETTAETVTETAESTAPPETEPVIRDFNPAATANTAPSSLIASTSVLAGGNVTGSYTAAQQIRFGLGSQYGQLDGVFAFRGNNFRSSSSFGTAAMTEKKFGDAWKQPITSLTSPDGNVWSGTGWTGQPLIVSWPKATRQVMNLYDWAKSADSLTEVIYATMDGNVYFLDLATGKQTRDPLFLGYTFKGSGSLDPRGYPLLYLGAGYDSAKGRAHAFVVSLIDGSILYEFGKNDAFAPRDWSCFDSSPLVDAETDTLIYPGENGVLYLVHLNSKYDETKGTLTVDPEIVRWTYQGTRSSSTKYWYGMEDSAVIWQGHLILADNGGNLFCLNLDTLKLDWAQDVLDDTNCSPVLDLEDGHPYVYISTSFHLGWRSSSTAEVPVWKIDAETGEVVWKHSYTCYSEKDLSGGAQGTIGLGQKNVSDLIFAPIARAGSAGGGVLSALRKDTGEVAWEFPTDNYSWSSPTVFYDQAGNGYLLYPTISGTMYLLDAATGKQLDTVDLGGHIESTPAVFDSTLVVGTRTNYIYGITLK